MLVEITNGLVKKGHDVTILMPKNAEVDYPLQATMVRTDSSTLSDRDYPYGDVIVSNFYTTTEAAESASKNGKGIHVRFSLCYEPPFLEGNQYSLDSYNKTKHVIVLSKWQHDLIQLIHGVQSHIVPIGVNDVFRNLNIRSSLSPAVRISATIRRPEGGFSSHREQPYLLNELRFIKQAYPFVQINLFCPPREFYMSPYLQALSESGEFRFITPGDDSEMCYHYNEADIFISSSSYDAGSLPGLEAMRCGAALATIYSGGNADYCRPEKNCLMSFRYEGRLAQDIARLIENPKLRKKLAYQGQRDSLSWTWSRSVIAFEKAIKHIMKEK
ncbi:glycosyltransferase family 4 protein [Alicyclobacillus fodiniaquatilis]|uniref:Glycosyltransferase family 4 protein n=1 Tax=Alicyclobacillus fodiniaquatilis TaxID=1661150 RepID=A0ABW4JM78_9BACL